MNTKPTGNRFPLIKNISILTHFIIMGSFAAMVIFQAKANATASSSHGTFLFHLMDSILCYGSFTGMLYLSYWLFIPKYLITKEYGKFILSLIALVAGFGLYFNLTATLIQHIFHVTFYSFTSVWWSTIFIYGFLLGVTGTSIRLFIQWIIDTQEKLELEKQQVKNELSHLKNQLNPRLILDTLTDIDRLVNEKSPEAPLVLNKLAQMMRFTVYDSQQERVPLQDEITYIQNYIDLRKMHLHEGSNIQWNISGSPEGKEIAPMTFISIIENAFMRSLPTDRPGSTINIQLDIQQEHISFECVNTLDDKTQWIRMDNVQKRLEIIYNSQHTLKMSQSETTLTVHLDIAL